MQYAVLSVRIGLRRGIVGETRDLRTVTNAQTTLGTGTGGSTSQCFYAPFQDDYLRNQKSRQLRTGEITDIDYSYDVLGGCLQGTGG